MDLLKRKVLPAIQGLRIRSDPDLFRRFRDRDRHFSEATVTYQGYCETATFVNIIDCGGLKIER